MKTLLYVPGLGSDKLLNLQRRYLKKRCKGKWNLVFFEPRWHSDENYEQKWGRLKKTIESLNMSNTFVMGASAGGPVVVRLLNEFPDIIGAHCISGKLSNAEAIGAPYRKRAPAIYDCVKASEQALTNASTYANKVTVFKPIFDNIVPIKDMNILGAKTKRLFAFEHTIGIALAMIFFFPRP